MFKTKTRVTFALVGLKFGCFLVHVKYWKWDQYLGKLEMKLWQEDIFTRGHFYKNKNPSHTCPFPVFTPKTRNPCRVTEAIQNFKYELAQANYTSFGDRPKSSKEANDKNVENAEERAFPFFGLCLFFVSQDWKIFEARDIHSSVLLDAIQ